MPLILTYASPWHLYVCLLSVAPYQHVNYMGTRGLFLMTAVFLVPRAAVPGSLQAFSKCQMNDGRMDRWVDAQRIVANNHLAPVCQALCSPLYSHCHSKSSQFYCEVNIIFILQKGSVHIVTQVMLTTKSLSFWFFLCLYFSYYGSDSADLETNSEIHQVSPAFR